MEKAILIISAVTLNFAVYVKSANHLNNVSENPIEWLEYGIQYIRTSTEGSLDVVLLDDSFPDDRTGTIFTRLRHFLSTEIVAKLESPKHGAHTRMKILFVLDGTDFRKLQKSLQQIRQSKRSRLVDKIHQYFFILSATNFTSDYKSLFQTPLSCHMIFIHLSTNDLRVHRISAADQRVRTFSGNTSIEHVLDDRPDWHGYEVRILTTSTRPPFSVHHKGELIGTDIETCKAIFNQANMRHRFQIYRPTADYWKFRASIENLLKNGSIHLVVSRVGFKSASGELLYLRDTDGSCLMVPRNLQRNFIYHLIHPFEFDTWMVVAAVILLDVILGLIFPIAFPHNLIMILLFGDSLADHEQTRWTRFYCFACTVFLFLLSEAYLAKVIIYMTLTRYTPDMKTLAQFVASDIPILIGPGIVAHLNQSVLLSQLLSKAIVDPNFSFHMDSDQYAYFVLCSFGQSLIEKQVVQNYLTHGQQGKRMFYLMEELVTRESMQYAVQYQFMFYARFQLTLTWLCEAGLWDKWKNDAQKKIENRVRYKLRDEDDILFLEDLVGVWYVSATGWAVSAAMFLMELVWFYGVGNARRVAHFIRGKLCRCCRKMVGK